jgi:hypothetical protein
MSTADGSASGRSPSGAADDPVSSPGQPPHDEAHEPDSRPQAPVPVRSHAPPSSPTMAAGWLLRATAGAAVAAAAVGVVLAPGMEGNAGDGVVKVVDGASASLAVLVWLLMIALTLWGATELLRSLATLPLSAIIVRVAMTASAGLVVVMSSLGLREQLPPKLAVLLAAVTTITALAGAYSSARAPHTRAIAGVLFALAFASITRLAAWEVATVAGDHASTDVYKVSRVLVTVGVVLEAIGQLVAAAWLGTRSRIAGQLASSAALVLAFAVTWGVAQGVHAGAWFWQAVLHKALGDAAGIPSPYGLDAVATFLVPASILLALVSASQPRQVVAIVTALAFALLSRGSFDAPLRALCVVVAALWAVLAGGDERAMWRQLIDDRKRRVEAS